MQFEDEGDHLELLDSTVSSRIRPARVEKVIGTRIWVRVNQMFLNQSDIDDSDIQRRNNILDLTVLIETVFASSKKSTNVPYEEHDTYPSLFKTYVETEARKDDIRWEKGMKLEVLDPLDTWKELRVSTVIEVMDDGFLKSKLNLFSFTYFCNLCTVLQIGFDGEEMEDDPVPLHSTSELLFPVGYAKKYGIRLRGPKNIETLSVKVLMNVIRILMKIFKFIKIGSKLEATDMCEPHLICPATIAGHRGRLLRIEYDGWDSSYDQLFDYRYSFKINDNFGFNLTHFIRISYKIP
ncbi:mbt repeat protein [Onchocerca flexuosa]|uniref:Mbt repeat protein n=1 Tax=Onchocerca flexuosa TaxID=387005 RepID=A0A238BKN1_9BILA|nr:mbt repeat protein [Onchocerca flexuosa]